ncbi:DNA helicase [Corynebacterium falsenii DSM 44353]|nr:DNA helicase [Corynebacterium falsenii DSM 44353]
MPTMPIMPNPTDKPRPTPRPTLWSTIRSTFHDVSAGLSEFYHAPYRRTMAKAARDEEDLFMLIIAGEALGVPNPASYYTLELLPLMYERFHDWHRRMGMEHSPIDGIACC